MAKLYTFDTRKQKKVLIGSIKGNTLTKNVDPAKHFMRRVDGYGIQYQALGELKRNEVKNIIIKESTGKEWHSTLKDWDEHASVADFGSGKQYFLSLRYMHLKGFKPEPLVKIKPQEPQLEMFKKYYLGSKWDR